MAKGKITTQYTIWCALCNEWIVHPTSRNKKVVARDSREEGWKKRIGVGWVFPRRIIPKRGA